MKFRGILFSVLAMIMIAGCGNNDTTTKPKTKVALINLGDSYANGVQSGGGNVNQYTQVNSYPQIIANQMENAFDLAWGNPLVNLSADDYSIIADHITSGEFAELVAEWSGYLKHRVDDSFLPYNVGVDGATVQSLLTETSDDWYYINELMKPIPTLVGHAVTQLEAAEYVASQQDESTPKIITILIGGNDILGTVNAGGGTQLTAAAINAFFADTVNGHDLTSVTTNLTTIIDRLKVIPNSHIFISNLPSVTGIAGLFSNEDIERLATYSNPHVTALAEGEYMGFGPFTYLSGALAADDATLNATIPAILAQGGNDAFSLTSAEADLIKTRTNEINAVINGLVAANDNVYLVDIVSFFDQVIAGDVSVGGTTILRSYGGGMFSLDGFHPSHTGYALIADVFIDAINDSGVLSSATIPSPDLASIHSRDPYYDKDGDGYFAGYFFPFFPIFNPMFNSFEDCNDYDATVAAPFPASGTSGSCL